MEAKDLAATPVRFEVLGAKGEVIHASEFSKDKVVLGRILSADLRIDDPRVSRIHALVERKGDGLFITDLASSHGTFVNGKKIVEQRLQFGDVIRLGFVEIRFDKGTGKIVQSAPSFQGKPVFEGDETLINIDRSQFEGLEKRSTPDRRKKDVFPDEKRMDPRRAGDRREDEKAVSAKGKSEKKSSKPSLPVSGGGGLETVEESDRRVGERRRTDRRIFDITSLERRIEDRRARKSDDDLLPEELEKAFTVPGHARELEVTVLWGDHILDVSNYYDPIVLSVGESPRNQYIIPSSGIPDEFPLVSIEDDGTAYLAFTQEMKGTVRARDKIYSIKELTSEKFVRKMADYFVLPLKQDDFAKLSIGNINFFILYVKPAPRVKPAPFFDRDALLVRTFIGSVLLMALFFATLTIIPKPKPVTVETMPERLAKIIIKKRPEIPKSGIVAKNMSPVEGGSVAGEGGPAIGEEGKAGKPNLPDKKLVPQAILPKSKPKDMTPPVATAKPAPTPTPAPAKPAPPQPNRKLVDANKAKSVGLLKAFSNSGLQKDLKNLINAGEGKEGAGGFDDFGKAVRGARGTTIEDTGGAGGMGLKGVEAGGGGKTIGIDGPSTKGLGRGYSGDGIGEGISGPGRLGQKGEHAISIVSENVQVLSGLPKDVINAVIYRHRPEIRACYDAALQKRPDVRGKVTVAFTIQANGIVSAASVKDDSTGDPGLGNCIVSRVKTWIFPKPEAPAVTEVSAYPFMLSPAK